MKGYFQPPPPGDPVAMNVAHTGPPLSGPVNVSLLEQTVIGVDMEFPGYLNAAPWTPSAAGEEKVSQGPGD